MNQLVCERCGANSFIEKNGYKICQYCNTKYIITLDDMPLKNTEIALSDDIKRLLDKCKNDPLNAQKYANLILDIDPTNKEAYQYL